MVHAQSADTPGAAHGSPQFGEHRSHGSTEAAKAGLRPSWCCADPSIFQGLELGASGSWVAGIISAVAIAGPLAGNRDELLAPPLPSDTILP